MYARFDNVTNTTHDDDMEDLVIELDLDSSSTSEANYSTVFTSASTQIEARLQIFCSGAFAAAWRFSLYTGGPPTFGTCLGSIDESACFAPLQDIALACVDTDPVDSTTIGSGSNFVFAGSGNMDVTIGESPL